jgi:LDH2 family malate/lactate/ureidoglycolate dehydrogenase
VNRTPGRINICHFFMAIDYSMFGEKEDLEKALSKYLDELRNSPKADGAQRIYTHGEKEFENRQKVLAEGISLNEKTYGEMQMIAEYTGASDLLPEYLN